MKPFVVILVLNWNNPTDTAACLESVARLRYANFKVVVVDNGSTDDSVVQLRRRFPMTEILETGANLGYAEGNNVGIRHALALGAEYVFVLNNDTTVSPTLLSELVELAEAHPQAGMIGPAVYCMEPDDMLFATGSFIDWAQGNTWNRDMFMPVEAGSGPARAEQVDFVGGCGVLVRRAAIETAGLLNAHYYLNYEDVEWAVRIRRHGFEIWYAPQAVMWHKISATFGGASPANTYYMTRNCLLFFWQNGPSPGLRLLAVAWVLLRTLRTVLAWSLKPRYRGEVMVRKRRANLMGVRDFLLGRFGPMGEDVSSICYPRR